MAPPVRYPSSNRPRSARYSPSRRGSSASCASSSSSSSSASDEDEERYLAHERKSRGRGPRKRAVALRSLPAGSGDSGGTSTGAIVAIVLVVLLLVAGAGLVWYGSQNDWFGLSSGESAASSAAPQSSSSASSAAPASSPSSVAASATAAATSSSGSTSAGSASATATSEEDSSASKISTFASAMKTEGDGAAKAPQATLFGLQTTNTEPATAWGYGLVTLTDDNKLSTGLLSYFIEGTSTSTTFIPTKAFPAGTPSPPHAISSPTGTVGKQATFPVWISPATVKEKSETVTGFMLSASISAPLFGDMGPVTSLLTSAPFELHEEVMVVIGVWKPLGAEDEDE